MIALDNLTFAYPGSDRPALRGIGMRIAPGEAVCLEGPGGAGKSTLLKVLAGVIRDYTGEAVFEGRELKAWSREYFESLGVALRPPGHFLKLTARENLLHFASLYRPRNAGAPDRPAGGGSREIASLALARVGLQDSADRPVGLFTPEMRWRLSLARAALHGPRILLLDDPLAGLDPAAGALVEDWLRAQKAEGRAMVLAARDSGLARRLGFRTARLREGALAGAEG